MRLPSPSPADEDAWVGTLAEAGAPEAVVEAIESAMSERRPRLAARLIELLGTDPCEDSTPVALARRAAGLLVVEGGNDPEPGWREFEEAFAEFRRRRIRRQRHRLRRQDPDGWPRGRRGR